MQKGNLRNRNTSNRFSNMSACSWQWGKTFVEIIVLWMDAAIKLGRFWVTRKGMLRCVPETISCVKISYCYVNTALFPTESQIAEMQEVFRQCWKCRVYRNNYVSGRFIYSFHFLNYAANIEKEFSLLFRNVVYSPLYKSFAHTAPLKFNHL